MRTWLAKSLYESLPFLYVVVGALLLAASGYLDDWRWRVLALFLGLSALAAGASIWWLRRQYRRNR